MVTSFYWCASIARSQMVLLDAAPALLTVSSAERVKVWSLEGDCCGALSYEQCWKVETKMKAKAGVTTSCVDPASRWHFPDLVTDTARCVVVSTRTTSRSRACSVAPCVSRGGVCDGVR
jgi:hypothetical protein